MCTGIALEWSHIPTELKGRPGLRRRVHHRGQRREAWFWYDDPDPRLPIRRNGRLELVRWGNGRGRSRYLPRTGWTWLATAEAGYWRQVGGRPVEVAANFFFDRGVWVHVRQGLRGILVPDERGWAVCYLLCEPASHYYQVMTRNDRMPLLIGDRI